MKFKNVRAGQFEGAKLDKDEHRWFHLICFNRDNKGFEYAIDFPAAARSEHTKCFGCRLPINSMIQE